MGALNLASSLRAGLVSALFLCFISANGLWLAFGIPVDSVFIALSRTLNPPSLETLRPLNDGARLAVTQFIDKPALPVRAPVFTYWHRSLYFLSSQLPRWSPGLLVAPHILMAPDGWLYVEEEIRPCQDPQEIEDLLDGIIWVSDFLKGHGKDFYYFSVPSKLTGSTAMQGPLFRGLDRCNRYNRELWQTSYEAHPHKDHLIFRDLLPLTQDLAKREAVYWRRDRHWNRFGQFNALQYVVETIQPGTTRPDDIRFVNIGQLKPDLSYGSLYIPDLEDSRHYIIERPSVRIKGRPGERPKNWPIMQFWALSDQPVPMIKGKTVLVTDSFFYYMSKYVGAYFEDLKMFHISQYDVPEFHEAVRAANTVIYAPVDRNIYIDGPDVFGPKARALWQQILPPHRPN